jgi:hypothetical protein
MLVHKVQHRIFGFTLLLAKVLRLVIYRQTCIKRPHKGNTQNGRLMKQSLKTKHDKKVKIYT